ncbi:MAG: nitroreductase family protein [Chloroflexi bacterium]|nr:nitroreductase family protein [Chloroflexota bacterium]
MLMNETLQVIRRRRSIRRYKTEQIQDEELQAILEAGLYAPNAGDQAWHFTVVQNKELLARLNEAAKAVARQIPMPGLQSLGKDANHDCLHGAPTLVIVSGDEQFPVSVETDCAVATENMLIAAESLGLGSCWIFFVMLAFSGPQSAELHRELGIPKDYKPYYAAVFGYKQEAAPAAADRKPDVVTYIR